MDTAQKRAASAGLHLVTLGVWPDATQGPRWRAAVAMSYGDFSGVVPPVGGGGEERLVLGDRSSLAATTPILGGGLG